MENNQIKNSTEVEYISMFDKPKRGKGRPKGSGKYTDEELLERHRVSNLKCYYNNHEYYKLYNKLNQQNKALIKKTTD